MPRTKKQVSPRKYDDDFRMKAFDLYCEGKSAMEIAQAMGVKTMVIHRLRIAKWPEDWVEARKRRVEAKIKKVEEAALDRVVTMKARHQQWFRAVFGAAVARLVQNAQSDKIPADILSENMFRAAQEEQKLYLPIREVHLKESKGSKLGAGIVTPDGTKVGIVAELSDKWDQINGIGDETKDS